MADDKFVERFLKSIRTETPDSDVWARWDRQRKGKLKKAIKYAQSPDEIKEIKETFSLLRKELITFLKHRVRLATVGFSSGRDSVKRPPQHRQCFASASTQSAFFRKIQSNYGLTKNEYLRMLTEQDSKCLCCGKELTLFASDRSVVPVVDHCHRTGKVRAILCTACNTVVGRVESASDIVQKARQYLELTTGQKPVSLD